MPSRTRFIVLAVFSLTAAACGLKGPLYRPDEPRREGATPANPAQTQKKKDNSSGTAPGEQSEPQVAPPDPDRPVVPQPGR
jgi:predicted small lipoprotein YifL